MKTVIAGSRTITDFSLMLKVINSCPWVSQITEVVCGESEEEVQKYLRGERHGNPDIFGAVWARNVGAKVAYFPAKWSGQGYGDPAGPIRNTGMAKYGEALILAQRNKSRGSADMLRKAKAAGYPPERIHHREV